MKFLPPNGKPYALNVVNGVVYMVTGDALFSPQTRSLGNAIVGAKLDDNQQLQLGTTSRRRTPIGCGPATST